MVTPDSAIAMYFPWELLALHWSLLRELLSEFQSSSSFPGELKKVSVNYKKIHSDAPYSEEVVQNCMQEALNFFYFILTTREDTDFILKDVGTLAIRGTEVTMAFCEDFLISLNRSTYVVQKLLTVSLLFFRCYLEGG